MTLVIFQLAVFDSLELAVDGITPAQQLIVAASLFGGALLFAICAHVIAKSVSENRTEILWVPALFFVQMFVKHVNNYLANATTDLEYVRADWIWLASVLVITIITGAFHKERTKKQARVWVAVVDEEAGTTAEIGGHSNYPSAISNAPSSPPLVVD